MRLRRTALAALSAAVIAVPTVTTAALASTPSAATASASASADAGAAASKTGKGGAERTGSPQPAKSSAKAGPKDGPKAGKPVKRVRFAASGRVVSVDAAAGTVTLYAKGGTKDVRNRTVTVVVPASAKVRVNGRRATVEAVAAGYRITVIGQRAGGVWTAGVLVAVGKVRPAPTPSTSPPVTPSPSPSAPEDNTGDAPDDDGGDDDGDGPTVSPSVSVTPGSSDD